MQKEGIILQGIGGYYTVQYDEKKRCILKARGKFRHLAQTPLPGDRVQFDLPAEGEEGAMGELMPRKNLLLRPRVANVEVLLAVVSGTSPPPDYLLLDKLCANAVANDIEVVCVMNKVDQTPQAERQDFLATYRAFSALCISAHTGEGFEQLTAKLKGRIVCLAGQSGVGKSSLLNRLLPEQHFDTGTLSEKANRGRHTTRIAQLVNTKNGGMMVDTPGFSLMELPLMDPMLLMNNYPEFTPYLGRCRFVGCLHASEPECAVKEAVQKGDIPLPRWERYQVLLEQCQTSWRNRYE